MPNPRFYNRAGQRFTISLLLVVAAIVNSAQIHADDLTQSIRVSPDGHFLAQPSGAPFFWLGDSAWALFERLTREEADRYLKGRAAKGFTVIQAVAIGCVEPVEAPNRYGERALLRNNPAKPNPRYFDHVDWIVNRAARYGLRVALLPIWNPPSLVVDGSRSSIMTPVNAKIYGRWLGARYRDKGIIWVLGGDATPIWRHSPIWRDSEDTKPPELFNDYRIYDALAEGIKEGVRAKPFITYHPSCCSEEGTAPPRTSLYLSNRDWLSMNMIQSSHFSDPRDFLAHTGFSFGWKTEFNYEPIFEEYRSEPTRPVIDGESRYENIRKNLIDYKMPVWTAYDSRNSAYHSLFAGAAGHTYGNNSIFQFFNPQIQKPQFGAGRSWMSELDAPGAQQIQYAKDLLLSRPYFSRIPDQSVLVGDTDEGIRHIEATRDREGSFIMVYLPKGQTVTIDMIKLSGRSAIGWWYDPRTGAASRIEGDFATASYATFLPPSTGPDQDWVLVLDDKNRAFATPGTVIVER